MGGIKNDRELRLRPTVALQQRLGVRRDQEHFRKDLWRECRLFIAGLLKSKVRLTVLWKRQAIFGGALTMAGQCAS